MITKLKKKYSNLPDVFSYAEIPITNSETIMFERRMKYLNLKSEGNELTNRTANEIDDEIRRMRDNDRF